MSACRADHEFGLRFLTYRFRLGAGYSRRLLFLSGASSVAFTIFGSGGRCSSSRPDGHLLDGERPCPGSGEFYLLRFLLGIAKPDCFRLTLYLTYWFRPIARGTGEFHDGGAAVEYSGRSAGQFILGWTGRWACMVQLLF